MPLTRLSLTDFRNHAGLRIEPGPGLVILTGENGAGKTNILEAVSLLAPGRGLRGASLPEMARSGGPGGFGVAARLAPLPHLREGPGGGGGGGPPRRFGGAGPGVGRARERELLGSEEGKSHPQPLQQVLEGSEVELATGPLAAAPERRQVRIHSAPAAASALAEWLGVLWLTPAMDRLFTDSAGGRRRFLDRLTLALHPAHAMHAARYEAAMRARNKLLAEERPDADWLTALEARMAEHGAAIEEARQATVSALADRLATASQSPFARAAIALENGETAPLAAKLREGRARDAAAARTLAGPHRADLLVTHAGKNLPAALCSTGEQKALLLNIVLAHAELVRDRSGRPLILLLDEVAAHLDPHRRQALWERLSAAGCQVWLTGTEPALFEGAGEDACRYRVQSGVAQLA